MLVDRPRIPLWALLSLLAIACGGQPAAGVRHEAQESGVPAPTPASVPDAFAAPPPVAASPLPDPPPPATVPGSQILEEVTSAYSTIRVVQRGGRRSLVFVHGGRELVQTAIDLDRPDELALAYAEAQAAALLYVPRPARALVLGLGGGTLPRYLLRRIPGVIVDAVEIDPEVVRLAAAWFGIVPGPQLRVSTADALAFVDRAEPGAYDLIYVDAFLAPNARGVDNIGIPKRQREEAAIAAIRERLAPGGAAVFNLHLRSGYSEHLAAITAVFPEVVIVKVAGSTQRQVIARTGEAVAREVLAERAAILAADGRFGVDFAALLGRLTREESRSPAAKPRP